MNMPPIKMNIVTVRKGQLNMEVKAFKRRLDTGKYTLLSREGMKPEVSGDFGC